MKKEYKPLFKPYTLNNGVTIKNRLMVAPLTVYDSGPNGELTDSARNFWHDRFRGFGTWIMPFTNVDPSGIGFESPNAFNRKKNLPTLKEYAHIGHEQGAKVIMQIGHSGYKARKWMTQGFAVESASKTRRAREMNQFEVKRIIRSFGIATQLAIDAGIDGVEIQGSNGWLIEQFFAPNINFRDDEWGGSLKKRMAFALAIIDEVDRVRKANHRPDFIVGYRFSPERPRQGFTMKDTLQLIDELVKKPLQYLHVSLLGFYHHVRRGADTSKTRMQVLHERINGKLPLVGVGELFTGKDLINAYNTGWAEFLAVGRAIMLNPHLIDLIKNDQEDKIETKFNWANVKKYRYTDTMLEAKKEGLDLAYRNPRPRRYRR